MDTPSSPPEIARLGQIYNWRFQQLSFDRYTKMLHAYSILRDNRLHFQRKNATVVEAGIQIFILFNSFDPFYAFDISGFK